MTRNQRKALAIITEDATINDEERLEQYETVIQEGEKYARESGLLD